MMEKIKITDLSVGDWVDVQGDKRQVYSINHFDIWLQSGGTLEQYGLDDVCPIPITPEILEANGFVKNGEYNEWNIGTWQTPYLLGVSLERPAITIKWNGSSIFIDQAKYVHQLQNALRLAGVDKEIVMPNK